MDVKLAFSYVCVIFVNIHEVFRGSRSKSHADVYSGQPKHVIVPLVGKAG